MIRVTIESSTGASTRLVSVRAESIERAVELVPGRVVFPLENNFFADGEDGSEDNE